MSSKQKEWHDETCGRSNFELNFNLEADKRFTRCTINIEGAKGFGKHVNGNINLEVGGRLAWSSGISLGSDGNMSYSIDLQDFVNKHSVAWAPIVIHGHISNAGVPPAGATVTATVEYDSITSEQKKWSDTTTGMSKFEGLDFPLEDGFKFTACLINIEGGSGVGKKVKGDVKLTIGGEEAWNSGINLGSGVQMSYYVDIIQFCESRHISWAPVEVTGHISNAGVPPGSATVLVTVVKEKM